VIGLEVPHAHIHLIPINSIADMNFSSPKLNLSSVELNDIAELIKSK
jgi:histidine triad (HIT) family protein